MSDLLDQYKAYYKTRAARFANNPSYTNSYKAESDLSDAMDSCSTLPEFKERIGNLNEICAVALVKDEHLMEQDFFNKHEETVRVEVANKVLDRLQNIDNVNDLITMVGEVSTETMIDISVDEANRLFASEWKRLDEIEIYENAIVPDAYKSELLEWADEARQKMKEAVADEEDNSRKFKPNWTYNPSANLEHRHRRLIPYSDEHLNAHLNTYKSIVNR